MVRWLGGNRGRLRRFFAWGRLRQRDPHHRLAAEWIVVEQSEARESHQEQAKQHEAIAAERRDQIKTGDRSEKIRTYNFPQNRVSDHRIGLTLHQLDQVMEGKLGAIVDALSTHYESERLKQELVDA